MTTLRLILIWIEQSACGLFSGHRARLLAFGDGRLRLRCADCGHETRGWR